MVPQEGRIVINQLVTRRSTYDVLTLHLAQDLDGTPDDTRTVANLTECDFDGYAPIDNPGWGAAFINGDGRAESQSGVLTWTAGAGLSAPQTIKAIYLTCQIDEDEIDRLLVFKRLSPTVTLALPGEALVRIFDMLDTDDAALD